MTDLTLEKAEEIIAATLAKGKEMNLKPLTVAVLDAGGYLIALQRDNGASVMRPQMAMGKAYGCIALGVGGRWLNQNGIDRPHFMDGAIALSEGKILPVPGGVLVKKGGRIIGAVGVTGDTSDNDEAAALTGIEKAGFEADAG